VTGGTRRLLWIAGPALALVGLAYASTRGCQGGRQALRVFVADALATAMTQIEEDFERENPDVDLRVTFEGSVMLLRMHLLHPADVVVLADYRLIEVGLRPGDADWAIKLATTEIVIARTQASRYADQITPENWTEILLRPDVLVSHPDPSIDPCGYYTRMAWELAERHAPNRPDGLAARLAAKSSAKYQRPDALSVLGLLQSRAVDYAFVYRCHAVDHHLPHVRLGDAISLGQPTLEDEYKTVQVAVPDYRGKTVTIEGRPIYFGLTTSKRSRQAAQAERFVRFLLSPKAQAILRRSEIVPLVPPRAASWSATPPPWLAESATIEALPDSPVAP
jgi:molybdate/tungstate transport system substrate-binding protein